VNQLTDWTVRKLADAMPGCQWNRPLRPDGDLPFGEFGSLGSPEFWVFEFWERGFARSCKDFSTFDPGSVRF
jgi:hypothetical protein